MGLMGLVDPNNIAGSVKFVENLFDLRMAHGLGAGVGQQVLLRNIGDIFGLFVFREKMVKGLVFARAYFGRNRQPPLFGVVECRINVENDAAKGKSLCFTTSPIWNFAFFSIITPPSFAIFTRLSIHQ